MDLLQFRTAGRLYTTRKCPYPQRRYGSAFQAALFGLAGLALSRHPGVSRGRLGGCRDPMARCGSCAGGRRSWWLRSCFLRQGASRLDGREGHRLTAMAILYFVMVAAHCENIIQDAGAALRLNTRQPLGFSRLPTFCSSSFNLLFMSLISAHNPMQSIIKLSPMISRCVPYLSPSGVIVLVNVIRRRSISRITPQICGAFTRP